MRSQRTFHIAADPEEVLSLRLDAAATPPGVEMAIVYESPDVEGSTYEWSFRLLGVSVSGITVVTEYAPGERLSFRNVGVMESTATWTVAPEEGGTLATSDVETRHRIPLVGRLLDLAPRTADDEGDRVEHRPDRGVAREQPGDGRVHVTGTARCRTPWRLRAAARTGQSVRAPRCRLRA